MARGEYQIARASIKDRHARIGAKSDVLALYDQIREIGRMYPGLLDEIENEARPGHAPQAVNGTEATLPLLDSIPAPPQPPDPPKRTNSLKGRKQSAETIRRRMETMARNRALKAKPTTDKPPGKRGRPRKVK